MNANARQPDPGVVEAERARAELYDTLSQLRDRLDYAQRIDDALERGRRRLVRVRLERPIAFAAGVASVAAVAGLVVWGVAQKVSRAFE